MAELYTENEKSFQDIDARSAAQRKAVTKFGKYAAMTELDSLIRAALTDTLKASIACLVDCELEKDLIALSRLDTTELAKLVLGERTLRDSKAISASAEKLAALKSTRDAMRRMLTYQRSREALWRRTSTGHLRTLDSTLNVVISDGEAIVKAQGDIKDRLDFRYVKLNEISGTSFIYDFNTRGALRIIPDFGMVAYGFQKGFTDIAPYLGVVFNFRQSKKNIPWGQYPNKTFWHYTSFTLAYTTATVAKAGEREDFFEKGSLLAGLGLRLSDEFRFTTGTMVFYRNSPNPALEQRTLACTLFLGISVDLDRKTLLNGWDKLTFKKN